jgi:hypothetical protein
MHGETVKSVEEAFVPRSNVCILNSWKMLGTLPELSEIQVFVSFLEESRSEARI